jgi:ribosome-associated protein
MKTDLKQLELTVIDALEEIKGQDIQLFDATKLTGMFDRVVVVSGTSNRQTRALAKNLHDQVKKAGFGVYGTEGEETGEWVLVDLGDIIVHIMQPAIREYYRLEEIWGAHPMDWRALQEAAKAAEKPAPRRKPTAKKPIVDKTPVKKVASKPVAEKKPASKSSVAKKSAAKTSTAKKPAGKPSTAKKPVAAKTPAGKKPAAKNPAVKKPAAKKPAASKTAPKKK